MSGRVHAFGIRTYNFFFGDLVHRLDVIIKQHDFKL